MELKNPLTSVYIYGRKKLSKKLELKLINLKKKRFADYNCNAH